MTILSGHVLVGKGPITWLIWLIIISETSDRILAGQCNSSAYGDRCETPCPFNCKRFLSDQECTECLPGQAGITCELFCKDRCAKCDIAGACLECKQGWSGRDCGDFCKYECFTCEARSDRCTSCAKGFYFDQTNGSCTLCTLSIMNCLSCSAPDNCTECKEGYYGAKCQPCLNNCLECAHADGSCLRCSKGLYGPLCNYVCIGKCYGDTCYVDTGACTGSCENGYHGRFCNVPCSSMCEHQICDKLSGTCTYCPSGAFGTLCEARCNDNCAGICDQNTGDCFDCKDKWFGRKCTEKCDNCKSCHQTGHCESCQQGYHGVFCNKLCPVNCATGTCDQYKGDCEGCKDKRYGPKCMDTCDNCTSCDQTGHCGHCQQGYYGAFCNMSCSVNCATGTCDELAGECIGCKDKWFGPKCTETCDNCASCNQTGHCGYCQQGYHGPFCNMSCPVNCVDGICNQTTSHCLRKTETEPNSLIVPLVTVGSIVVVACLCIPIICVAHRMMSNRRGGGNTISNQKENSEHIQLTNRNEIEHYDGIKPITGEMLGSTEMLDSELGSDSATVMLGSPEMLDYGLGSDSATDMLGSPEMLDYELGSDSATAIHFQQCHHLLQHMASGDGSTEDLTSVPRQRDNQSQVPGKRPLSTSDDGGVDIHEHVDEAEEFESREVTMV